MIGKPTTYGQLLAQAQSMLGSSLAAKQLFTFVTQKNLMHMSFLSSKPVPEKQVDLLLKLCQRRLDGEPLQYLLGEWEFYGLPIKVGPGVLIPRADTEALVDVALKLIENTRSPEVLDLCSGTGCIALAISHMRRDASVTAVELSEAAYGYLIKNIALNRSKVHHVRADHTEYSHLIPLDLIVANPPYIPKDVIPTLQPEVRREPMAALDGGKDGLSHYRSIMKRYSLQVARGGYICFEVGIGQTKKVMDIMASHGFTDLESTPDLNGVPRVVSGKRQ
jgi:release factor glutamine methyltransferase